MFTEQKHVFSEKILTFLYLTRTMTFINRFYTVNKGGGEFEEG